ncbi:hypothetical protein ACHQM5_017390 [Ranunculus cassubicifolius]
MLLLPHTISIIKTPKLYTSAFFVNWPRTNPKSPIFGTKSLSRSILLALISLCTIGGSSSS